MPAGSIDRRVVRTRNLLQEALFKLTAERGYEALTVEDICREANVGRSTFYTHYPDKESLRKSTIDEHMKALQVRSAERGRSNSAGGFSFSGPVFAFAEATREMHRALMGGHRHDVPEEIRSWIGSLIRQELAGRAGHNECGPELDVATRFVAGAFFEVLHWWIDADRGLSPEAVDRLFQHLALSGVDAALSGRFEAP